MSDRFTPARLGDYVTFCDICGQKCWESEATTLSVETGRGGCHVCSECADPVDYGLIPYKIRAEQPVPIARDTTSIANPSAIPQIGSSFIAEDYDWTNSPNYINQANATWDKLTFLTWDQWNVPWGFKP